MLFNKIREMRKEFIAITVLVLSLLNGCTGNDDRVNGFNYLAVNYPLDGGVIQYYGMPEGGSAYNFDITLFSSGITYNSNSGTFDGKGHIVYFELFSQSPGELVSGTYTFDSSGAGSHTTVTKGNFGMNVNFINDTGVILHVVSGSVTVERDGFEYNIGFSCGTDDDETITGSYRGFLTRYGK